MKKLFTFVCAALFSASMLADQALLSWQLGADGADAEAANVIIGAAGSEAEGFTIAMTGNASKNWGAGGKVIFNEKEYKTLKNSNGAQNTVTLPAGKKASKVEFYVTNNYDDRGNGVLNEWNGAACNDVVSSLTDYNKPTRISKTFAVPVSEFTFTFSAVQVCFIAVITLADDKSTTTISCQQSVVSCQKVIRDGRMLIIRDGRTYSVTGLEIEKIRQ